MYEKAVFDSELSKQERTDVAGSYMEYLKECSLSIAQIKNAYIKMRDNEVLDLAGEQTVNQP